MTRLPSLALVVAACMGTCVRASNIKADACEQGTCPDKGDETSLLAIHRSKELGKQVKPDRGIPSIWDPMPGLPWFNQTTCDLSGDPSCTLYWSCTNVLGPAAIIGPKDVQRGTTFVTKRGHTDVSLFDKRKDRQEPGCLLRKTRTPIDLSQIGRIELDVKVSESGDGYGTKAPGYAIWLAPMLYSFADQQTSAETNLIQKRGDNVVSRFPSCEPGVPNTNGYCKPLTWDVPATKVDHHITLTAKDKGSQGRVIEIRHCKNGRLPLTTCEAEEFAEIKVTKPNPDFPGDWFPIWNKTQAGDRYGHYWLITDIWFTGNTGFELSTNNVRFYTDEGSEWKMPAVMQPLDEAF